MLEEGSTCPRHGQTHDSGTLNGAEYGRYSACTHGASFHTAREPIQNLGFEPEASFETKVLGLFSCFAAGMKCL